MPNFFFFAAKGRVSGSPCSEAGEDWAVGDAGSADVEFPTSDFSFGVVWVDVISDGGSSCGVIGGSVEVVEKLRTNKTDAAGARLKPTMAAPPTDGLRASADELKF
jgi:hypothetical protein